MNILNRPGNTYKQKLLGTAIVLSGIFFSESALALCTATEPNVTLPVPTEAIQRDTVAGTVLVELISTVEMTCDPTGYTGPSPGYWFLRVATSNIDYGTTDATMNARKIGYEGLALYWNMIGATFSRFPFNDPSHVFRIPVRADVPGTGSTENTFRILVDSPKKLAGTYPGYTLGLDLYENGNSTTSYGRIVTFTIPPFTVNAVACSVTQPTITIPMGNDIPTFRFKGVGTTIDEKPVSIDLDCDAQTRVNIKLEGRTVAGTPGVLALNAESGVATGIGIQMLKDGVPVTFNTPTAIGTTPVSGPYSIEYTARYYQTGASVTGGKANATAQFTMTYQ